MLSKYEFFSQICCEDVAIGTYCHIETPICVYGQAYFSTDREDCKTRLTAFYYPIYGEDMKRRYNV